MLEEFARLLRLRQRRPIPRAAKLRIGDGMEVEGRRKRELSKTHEGPDEATLLGMNVASAPSSSSSSSLLAQQHRLCHQLHQVISLFSSSCLLSNSIWTFQLSIPACVTGWVG